MKKHFANKLFCAACLGLGVAAAVPAEAAVPDSVYLMAYNVHKHGGLVFAYSADRKYWTGIGPEHAYLHDTGRAEYVSVTDDEAVEAFEYLARTEGIICAIESVHAVYRAMKLAPTLGKDESIVVCLSGRGDKDVAAIARYRGVDIHE